MVTQTTNPPHSSGVSISTIRRSGPFESAHKIIELTRLQTWERLGHFSQHPPRMQRNTIDALLALLLVHEFCESY